MDGWSVFARMLYGVKAFYGFEWRLFFAMRVLVLSRMGSHTLDSIIYEITGLSLYEFCTDAPIPLDRAH